MGEGTILSTLHGISRHEVRHSLPQNQTQAAKISRPKLRIHTRPLHTSLIQTHPAPSSANLRPVSRARKPTPGQARDRRPRHPRLGQRVPAPALTAVLGACKPEPAAPAEGNADLVRQPVIRLQRPAERPSETVARGALFGRAPDEPPAQGRHVPEGSRRRRGGRDDRGTGSCRRCCDCRRRGRHVTREGQDDGDARTGGVVGRVLRRRVAELVPVARREADADVAA